MLNRRHVNKQRTNTLGILPIFLLSGLHVLGSFRYIGDTLGYDRCHHVSKVVNDLWVDSPRGRVHPVPGPPGDDLPGRSKAPALVRLLQHM